MKQRLQKRQEAEERNDRWSLLTPQEQLKALDRRGLIAAKQRVRIRARIEAEHEAQVQQKLKKARSKKGEK